MRLEKLRRRGLLMVDYGVGGHHLFETNNISTTTLSHLPCLKTPLCVCAFNLSTFVQKVVLRIFSSEPPTKLPRICMCVVFSSLLLKYRTRLASIPVLHCIPPIITPSVSVLVPKHVFTPPHCILCLLVSLM